MLEILFLVLWLTTRSRVLSTNTPEADRPRLQKRAQVFKIIFLCFLALDIVLTIYYISQFNSGD